MASDGPYSAGGSVSSVAGIGSTARPVYACGGYSWRSASTGAMEAARCAGTNAANTPRAASNAVADASVAGSFGRTPYGSGVLMRPAASDKGSPMRMPSAIRAAPSRSTVHWIRAGAGGLVVWSSLNPVRR